MQVLNSIHISYKLYKYSLNFVTDRWWCDFSVLHSWPWLPRSCTRWKETCWRRFTTCIESAWVSRPPRRRTGAAHAAGLQGTDYRRTGVCEYCSDVLHNLLRRPWTEPHSATTWPQTVATLPKIGLLWAGRAVGCCSKPRISAMLWSWHSISGDCQMHVAEQIASTHVCLFWLRLGSPRPIADCQALGFLVCLFWPPETLPAAGAVQRRFRRVTCVFFLTAGNLAWQILPLDGFSKKGTAVGHGESNGASLCRNNFTDIV